MTMKHIKMKHINLEKTVKGEKRHEQRGKI